MSRVDLRRCDRCHGEYDANLVAEPFTITHPQGYPLDLCRHCTSQLAGFLDELPPVTDDIGDGIHLGAMVTRDHLDRVTRSMSDYVNDTRAHVDHRVDELAAKPLVIP